MASSQMKKKGNALTHFSRGNPGVMPPFREFLQHQRSAAKREPAPAQPSFDHPIVLHRESDAIQVKANRQFHVGDVEEGEHFVDIVIGVRTGIHAWSSRNYLQLR